MNEKEPQDSSIPVDEMTPEQVRREFSAQFGNFAGIDDDERYLYVAMARCMEIALEQWWHLEITPYHDGRLVAEFCHTRSNASRIFTEAQTLTEALARLVLTARRGGAT